MEQQPRLVALVEAKVTAQVQHLLGLIRVYRLFRVFGICKVLFRVFFF